jgi:hypothetical protein
MKWNPFASDSMAHELFQPRPDGAWDYFPHGRFGRGYRVNEAQKNGLVDSLLRFRVALSAGLAIVFALAIVFISQIGDSFDDGGKTARTGLAMLAFFSVCAAAVLLSYWHVRRLVRDLLLAETRLTAAAEYRLSAARLPKSTILLAAAVGSVGCVGALVATWHVLRSGDWLAVPIAVLSVAAAAWIAWYYVHLWRYRPK